MKKGCVSLKNKTIHISNHGFEPVIDKFCTILILGSFPSVKSRETSFYYMHPNNRFWPLLSIIFNVDFTILSIKEKEKTLLKHHIALYDVLISCDVDGSKDSSINNAKATDVFKLISNTKINRIFINGKTAYNLFLKYNPSLKVITTYLPSTSSANARYNLDKLYNYWKTIKID